MKTQARRTDDKRSLRSLWGRIRDIEIAMLTTVDQDGMHHSRPMATQAIEADEFLWFFAAKDSGKVKAIRANPQVSLAYVDAARNVYVAACGRARVMDNDAKARKLWSNAAQAWFSGGPEDANLVLIEVDVDQAQWWDGSDSGEVDLG